MELTQLKAEWNKHNSYLENQHKLNEELLKKVNLDNSRKELGLPYKAEIGACIVLTICSLLFLPQVVQLWDNPYYFLSGISCLAITIGGAIIASVKIKSFASIDLFGSSIVKLQSDLIKLRKTIYRLVKFELLGIPLLFLGLPAAIKVLRNQELFEINFLVIGITLATCLLVLIPFMIWMYKKLYSERIERAKHHLKEIEKFQSEVE